MTRSAWAVVCAAALCPCVSAQTPVTTARQAPTAAAPVDETPEQRETRRMLQEYLTGDADAAVAFFAGRPRPGQTPGVIDWPRALVSDRGLASGFRDALFTTEVAMRRRTFGKYAMSAPLETSKTGVVGLNGAFELESFMLYRNLDDLLHVVRNEALPRALPVDSGARVPPQPSPIPPGERALAEKFFRQWHVVTISYCARWQLDCADTLLASAQRYFGDAADVLVLSAALAEAQGDSSNAQTLLRRALSVDPNHASAHLRLGRLLVAAGRTTDGARELTRALDRSRAEQNDGAAYFALTSLADLDARAGRKSARSRRTDAASLKAFDHSYFDGIQPDAIYRAGLFYEQPWRVAALRRLAR